MVTVDVLALPKEREATSAKSLAMPAIESVDSGDENVTRCQMASACANRLAITDLVELSWLAQLMVGVLLDHAAT